jgi:glycosyltransferase 2 family protein
MKRILQALAGMSISAAALYYTLRGKDLGAIWAAIVGADYRWVALYLVLLVAIHFLRTVRWGILLEPVATIPFSRLNAASAVGFMALVILPFRLGEFARPYLIADRPRLRVSAALSSVVVERVVDGMFTALLLVVALLTMPASNGSVVYWRWGGTFVFLAFGALLLVLVLAYRNRAGAVRLTHRFIDPVSPRVAGRLAGMMDAFIHGLRLVPNRAKVALFFALTVTYWGVNGLGLILLGKAFGFRLGLAAGFTVLGILIVGVMIPAGPGLIGTFQAFVLAGLALFLPKETVQTAGTAYANLLWGVQVFQQVAFGLVFLFSRHIQLGRIFHAPEEVGEELEEEETEYQGRK